MGQALYRKFRPRKFSEIVGQEHITTTLENAIKKGRISHAYLFSGPRGVGKTSVARILAREVNDLPYSDEDIQLDIIEIDAASNRRIDEVRDLREKVHIAPTSSKYKVYIIDEVHMLTREAFNALLKTLEEPPTHCIFILATTEAHKLPETIVSRTQHFSFKPIVREDTEKHLSHIAKKEKIAIEPEALRLLAEHGQGSFRDSISLLDQLSSQGNKITAASVRLFLGLPPAAATAEIIEKITTGDSRGLLAAFSELRIQGISPTATAKQLSDLLRKRLIEQDGTEPWITRLLRALLDVPSSTSPLEQLEISLLEAAGSNRPASKEAIAVAELKVSRLLKTKQIPSRDYSQDQALEERPVGSTDFSLDQWEEIVQKVKQQAASLYTALRLAIPEYNEGILRLAFQFPLHQKKVNRAENLQKLEKIIEESSGFKPKIESTLNQLTPPKKASPAKPPALSGDKTNIQTISNIFGSAEVLES